MKKTVVIGASSNPERYSYKAVSLLSEFEHDAIPIGIKSGEIEGHKIITERPLIPGVHTVSLYVGPQHQPDYYEYIFSLSPQRIIMNPGTENEELKKLAENKGIEVQEACTLVMLKTNQF